MYGIFVNENGCIPYARAIAQGIKPIETRSRNMLKALVGQRVAIIRTRRGERPTIVGYAVIKDAEFHTAEALDYLRDLTLIPKGSKYDCTGRGKWCYIMGEAEECEPYELPSSAIRHGRSYAEF